MKVSLSVCFLNLVLLCVLSEHSNILSGHKLATSQKRFMGIDSAISWINNNIGRYLMQCFVYDTRKKFKYFLTFKIMLNNLVFIKYIQSKSVVKNSFMIYLTEKTVYNELKYYESFYQVPFKNAAFNLILTF